jgi:hypothetical protein
MIRFIISKDLSTMSKPLFIIFIYFFLKYDDRLKKATNPSSPENEITARFLPEQSSDIAFIVKHNFEYGIIIDIRIIVKPYITPPMYPKTSIIL